MPKGFGKQLQKFFKALTSVSHKPIRTISNIFKKRIDQISEEASKGIAYKIKCKDCPSVYIGQISRALLTKSTSDRNNG